MYRQYNVVADRGAEVGGGGYMNGTMTWFSVISYSIIK